MRLVGALALTFALVAPVTAQDLQRPDDWKIRFDNAGMSEADLESFVEMPPGWHVTSGPAGIYWAPRNTITGEYRAEMEVFLFNPQGMREAFGMFVGGRDLEGDGQRYTYFLLRDGGQYIVKGRDGADAPTLRPWTGHNAILGWEDHGDEASVKNVLAIEVREGHVAFFVNDAEVARVERVEVAVDGIFGFRVNHRLNLHISRLEATPIR